MPHASGKSIYKGTPGHPGRKGGHMMPMPKQPTMPHRSPGASKPAPGKRGYGGRGPSRGQGKK